MLPDSNQYTGHCFQKLSATLLAKDGSNLISLKRLGWKSSTTAEGYIKDSIENKIGVTRKVLGVNPVDLVNPVNPVNPVNSVNI